MRTMLSLMGVVSAGGVFYLLREVLDGARMTAIAEYCGRCTLSMYAIHPVVLLMALNVGVVVETVTLVPVCVITAMLCWGIHDVIYKLPAVHILLFGQRRIV